MQVMGFAPLVPALLRGEKTVTRRSARGAASRLAPGDLVRAVETRHVRRGRHVRTAAVLRIEEVGPAPPLDAPEASLEGFASPALAAAVYARIFGERESLVRIRFRVELVAAPQLARLAAALGPIDRGYLEGLAVAAAGGRWLPLGTGRLLGASVLLPPELHREACALLRMDPADLWRWRPPAQADTLDLEVAP